MIKEGHRVLIKAEGIKGTVIGTTFRYPLGIAEEAFVIRDDNNKHHIAAFGELEDLNWWGDMSAKTVRVKRNRTPERLRDKE